MVLSLRRILLGALLASGLAGPAFAQPMGASLPFALGGAFTLIDQYGHERSEADPAGRPQLLFFGYAACEQICSVALPMMAASVAALAEEGLAVTPVMITVDPARDTPEVLAGRLGEVHPDFVGLTGSEAALDRVYAAFGIEVEPVYVDPFLGDVFAHGSFVYLLDGQGRFLTLFPPVLAPERVAQILRSHLAPSARG